MNYFFLSVAVAYSCAVLGGLWMHKATRSATLIGFMTVAALLPCPLFISPERTIVRGFAAIVVTDLMLKVVDYLRHLRRQDREPISAAEYLRFLLPFPILLAVLEHRMRRLAEPPRMAFELIRMMFAAVLFGIGSGLLYGANQLTALQTYFVLDHLAKLAIVLILVESASRFLHHLERLAGYDTLPPMLNIVASRTVGEFWCRWNTRIHSWLQYNVFVPVGGLRTPIRGVVYSFFWSAVLHEVMIGIAASRFDGYQFSFFMMQVPPVLLSRRLERFAHRHGLIGKALIHLLTISWISVTSVLFFRSIDRVFPFFYVSTPWLP